jgi:hypothetical protein
VGFHLEKNGGTREAWPSPCFAPRLSGETLACFSQRRLSAYQANSSSMMVEIIVQKLNECLKKFNALKGD